MMDWKQEWKPLLALSVIFVIAYYLPVDQARFTGSIIEGLALVRWYAREHVVLCLIPAFFIAGAISVFTSSASVMKYLGPKANPVLAYGVASVAGSILAVCSCTVLPIFAGIHRMGAGLGPATTFLYSGPAINAMAMILTARVLGLKLGIARAVGAVLFGIVIGILMHLFFRESKKGDAPAMNFGEANERPLWKTALLLFVLVVILVCANWAPTEDSDGLWAAVYRVKWVLTGMMALLLLISLYLLFQVSLWKLGISASAVVLFGMVFHERPLVPFTAGIIALSVVLNSEKGEAGEWFSASWGFAKQILPLLLAGVFLAGVLLGRPGREGLIPSGWIDGLVGGNSVGANFFAAFVGAFMYFATLTEVPILKGLIDNGMGSGPALALLLAGPALSLPNMLVIRSVMGNRKTAVFVVLVILMATVSGVIFGLVG